MKNRERVALYKKEYKQLCEKYGLVLKTEYKSSYVFIEAYDGCFDYLLNGYELTDNYIDPDHEAWLEEEWDEGDVNDR